MSEVKLPNFDHSYGSSFGPKDSIEESVKAPKLYSRAKGVLINYILHTQTDTQLIEMGYDPLEVRGIRQVSNEAYALVKSTWVRYMGTVTETAVTFADLWEDAAGSIFEDRLDAHPEFWLKPWELPRPVAPAELSEINASDEQRQRIVCFFDEQHL